MPTAITHDPVFTTPVSSTNTAVVRWSGTAGAVLQDSGVLIDGSNNITGIAGLTATQVDITGQGDLRLQDTTGGQYVALEAAGTTTTHTLTFPATQGSASTFLQNNGSGALSWAAASGLRGIVVLNPVGIDDTTNGALGVVAPHPWVGCRPTTAGNNGSAFFSGSVPSDFTTLNSAKLVCLGVEGSTNVRLGDNTCKIAAHSEINTTHSNTMATADYAITTNEILHIDISSLFTNLAANDSFAFNIRRNGSHGNDTVTTFYIYSAILEYS